MIRINGAMAFVAMFASIVFSSAIHAQAPAALKLTVKETPIGTIPSSGAISMAISTDNKQVVILTRKGDKMHVSINGKPQKEYDWIIANSLTVSQETNRHAYIVQSNDQFFPVIDGKEATPYAEIAGPTVYFSPKGVHVAYWGKKKAGAKTWVLNIDGKEGKEYEQVSNVMFSADGKRWAHAAQTGEKQFFVIDGEENKSYDKVAAFAFSQDSRRVAYTVMQDKKVWIIVDGQQVGPAEDISAPYFSPDGNRLIYTMVRDKRSTIVVDGKDGSTYDHIYAATIRFSPDSKRLAFIAKNKADEKGLLILNIDGLETSGYDNIVSESFMFSPDSKRTAFQAARFKERGHKVVMVVDGVAGQEYDEIRQAQFSPDGKSMVYLARRDNRVVVVVNGQETAGYDAAAELKFSPEGNRLAYVGQTGTKSFLVVDGAKQQEFDVLFADTVAWSPDGKHFGYLARRGERPVVIVDQTEGPSFDHIMRGSKIHWDSATALHTLGMRDKDKTSGDREVVLLNVEVGK
jgi:Tol biopolymer transport system component